MHSSLKHFIYSIAIFGIIFSCKENSSHSEPEFACSDVNQISKIELHSSRFNTQTLTKNDVNWYLNDSILVRPDAIANILKVIPSIKIMYYPPKVAWENMIESIIREGGSVAFKDKNNKIVKSYHLGGTTNDERGTYAMLANDTKPFVVHVPGFEGNIATRFFMKNLDWRDRDIMIIDQKSLRYFKLTYIDDIHQSFEIINNKGSYKLKDHLGSEKMFSKELVLDYLGTLKSIGSESIENDFKYKDMVLASTPHAILEYTQGEKSKRLIFYANRLEGLPDPERMFVFDGKDFYLAQIRILQKLFRGIDYFELKN